MSYENQIQLLTPSHWKDYELIDCGSFEKLERFGQLLLIRPEPQAVWPKALSDAEWDKRHHIRFKGRSATSGDWIKKTAKAPDRWHVDYANTEVNIRLRLGLTSFKHVGVFPEQAVNWDYISESVRRFKNPKPKVLNFYHPEIKGVAFTSFYYSFCWKHPHQVWFEAKAPIIIDLGGHFLYQLKQRRQLSGNYAYLHMITRKSFIEQFVLGSFS